MIRSRLVDKLPSVIVLLNAIEFASHKSLLLLTVGHPFASLLLTDLVYKGDQ